MLTTRGWIVLVLFTLAFGIALHAIPALQESSHSNDLPVNLKDCEYEDSMDCHWNARKNGNGKGKSFVIISDETAGIPVNLNDSTPGYTIYYLKGFHR